MATAAATLELASTLPVDCTDTVQRQKGAHSTCERTPYAAVRWYECVPLCVRTNDMLYYTLTASLQNL